MRLLTAGFTLGVLLLSVRATDAAAQSLDALAQTITGLEERVRRDSTDAGAAVQLVTALDVAGRSGEALLLAVAGYRPYGGPDSGDRAFEPLAGDSAFEMLMDAARNNVRLRRMELGLPAVPAWR